MQVAANRSSRTRRGTHRSSRAASVAGIVRRIVRAIQLTLGIADQFATAVLDDKTEPTAVGIRELLTPLPFAELNTRRVADKRVCVVPRLHVKIGQRWDVVGRRVPNDKAVERFSTLAEKSLVFGL